jgi:hypothetical protein
MVILRGVRHHDDTGFAMFRTASQAAIVRHHQIIR